MAIGSLSGIDSLTSLISMQSSVRSAGSVRSAQNELETEALVYKPSAAYAGDPKKADALTAKAQSLNGTIGKIASDVQNNIQDSQDSAQKAAEPQNSGDGNANGDKVAQTDNGLTYDSNGNLLPAKSLDGSGTNSTQTGALNQLA